MQSRSKFLCFRISDPVLGSPIQNWSVIWELFRGLIPPPVTSSVTREIPKPAIISIWSHAGFPSWPRYNSKIDLSRSIHNCLQAGIFPDWPQQKCKNECWYDSSVITKVNITQRGRGKLINLSELEKRRNKIKKKGICFITCKQSLGI